MRRPIEVMLVVAIVGVLGLLIMMEIPRQRESARTFQCRENLRRIGLALALDSRNGGRLPAVPKLGPIDSPAHPGPLVLLLDDLGQRDFSELKDTEHAPPRKSASLLENRGRIAGLRCPSDPTDASKGPATLLNYRTNAGNRPDGGNGVFAPGRILTTSQVDAADGLQFTASVSERLVGNGQNGSTSPSGYAIAADLDACDIAVSSSTVWQADAGRSRDDADWRSSLYNHVLPPNGKPSCITKDGQSARMGASSGHGSFVHVLTLDGGVRSVGNQVDLKIWRALADVGAK